MHFAPWNIDNRKIVTRREMDLGLADLKTRAERSTNAHFDLILFRLAACCGLTYRNLRGLLKASRKAAQRSNRGKGCPKAVRTFSGSAGFFVLEKRNSIISCGKPLLSLQFPAAIANNRWREKALIESFGGQMAAETTWLSIAVGIATPLASALVSGYLVHKLAEKRSLRETARQIFREILRHWSEWVIFFVRMHTWVRSDEGRQPRDKLANDRSHIANRFLEIGIALDADAVMLPIIFGAEANRLAEIIGKLTNMANTHLEESSAFGQSDSQACFWRTTELKAEAVKEIERLWELL